MPEGTASLSFHYMLLRFTGKHDKKNTSVYRVLTSYDVWQKRLISRIRLKMRFMTFTVSFSTIDLVNTFCFGLGKCDCNKKNVTSDENARKTHNTKKTQENFRVDATYHRWNFRQKKTNKLQKKNKHSLLFGVIPHL